MILTVPKLGRTRVCSQTGPQSVDSNLGFCLIHTPIPAKASCDLSQIQSARGLSGWLTQQQNDIIDFLMEENRTLQGLLGSNDVEGESADC